MRSRAQAVRGARMAVAGTPSTCEPMSMLPTVPPAERTAALSLAARSVSLSLPWSGLAMTALGSAHGLRIGPASNIAKNVTAYPRWTLGATT